MFVELQVSVISKVIPPSVPLWAGVSPQPVFWKYRQVRQQFMHFTAC